MYSRSREEAAGRALPRCFSVGVSLGRHHFEWRDEYQAAFASAVLRWSTTDLEAVVRLASALTSSLGALGDYLDAVTIVATHEPEVVPRLTRCGRS